MRLKSFSEFGKSVAESNEQEVDLDIALYDRFINSATKDPRFLPTLLLQLRQRLIDAKNQKEATMIFADMITALGIIVSSPAKKK